MKKRVIALTLALFTAVSVLSGCKGKETSGGNVTKITMWTANSHSKLEMENLVNEFNRTVGKEKGIEFEYIIKENDLSKQVELRFQQIRRPTFSEE